MAKPRGCLWQWLQIYSSGGFQALLTVLASGQNPLLSGTNATDVEKQIRI